MSSITITVLYMYNCTHYKCSSHRVLAVLSAIGLNLPQGYKRFSCSTQLSMNFVTLINVKVPTIVCILTFMSRKYTILRLSDPGKSEFLDIFILMSI